MFLGAYELWRQQQMEQGLFPVALADEPKGDDREAEVVRDDMRYWAYAYNTNGYRLKCEDAWRRMWARGETA